MITSGEGKTKVYLEKYTLGEDLLIVISGGDKSHIGSSVICTPGGRTRVLTLDNHKDHLVLEPIAKAACEKYQKVVAAVGGIHINDASEEEIDEVVENCKRLEECI